MMIDLKHNVATFHLQPTEMLSDCITIFDFRQPKFLATLLFWQRKPAKNPLGSGKSIGCAPAFISFEVCTHWQIPRGLVAQVPEC
jgi:hypothetical protein